MAFKMRGLTFDQFEVGQAMKRLENSKQGDK